MNALTKTFTLPAIENLSTELVASNKVLADAVHEHIAPAMDAAGSRCPTGMQYKWFVDLTAKAVWPDMKSPTAEKIETRPEIERAMLVTVRAAVAEELSLLLAQAAATG
ncbi:MAG: hypothetical protein K9L82_16960, partial [Chromatiaceae bacterium]|nr:hypothetical protein [Chromatiaceae bacterium]